MPLFYFYSALLPDGLAEETLRTIDFLFPRYSPSARLLHEILDHAGERMNDVEVDRLQNHCDFNWSLDQPRIEDFPFWHDRFVVLKEYYDNASPKGLRGLWRDRRRKDQWFNSWIGILAIFLAVFFGLVQSIEGAIQVYKAYHPSPS
jgi:hypothetical protein